MGQDRDGLRAASGQIVSCRQLKRLCVSSLWCTQTHAGHLLIGSMNPHLIPFLCAPNLSCSTAYRKKTELSFSFYLSVTAVSCRLLSAFPDHVAQKIKTEWGKICAPFDIVKQKCDPFFYRGNSVTLHYLIKASHPSHFPPITTFVQLS